MIDGATATRAGNDHSGLPAGDWVDLTHPFIDTASIDHGPSTLFGAYVALCGGNVPIFENVADFGRLPETDAFVVALPMKIAGGSGGPLRIVARMPGPVPTAASRF